MDFASFTQTLNKRNSAVGKVLEVQGSVWHWSLAFHLCSHVSFDQLFLKRLMHAMLGIVAIGKRMTINQVGKETLDGRSIKGEVKWHC